MFTCTLVLDYKSLKTAYIEDTNNVQNDVISSVNSRVIPTKIALFKGSNERKEGKILCIYTYLNSYISLKL